MTTRLAPDPAVGVSDLCDIIEQYIVTKEGNRDLRHICELLKDCTWKSAADVSVLCSVAPLLTMFCKVAPNGVVSSSKLRTALMKCNVRQQLLHGTWPFDHFADKFDNSVRIGLSKLRELLTNTLARERAYKKARVYRRVARVVVVASVL
jgi:hypothetical protein